MQKGIFICLIMCSSTVFGQVVNYADSVISFSSEYSTGSWSAEQVLDTADVYPNYGNLSGGAWTSASIDNQREYLELYS